jgi:hypothetical protein
LRLGTTVRQPKPLQPNKFTNQHHPKPSAAIHLASLWHGEGKGSEARDVLVPIYG